MPLDPQAQVYLDQMAALSPAPMHTFSPEVVRQDMKMELIAASEPESVAHVENRVISGPGGEIPLRILYSGRRWPFSTAGLLSRRWLGGLQS